MDPVWPYLTADIPSVPAGIKRRDEDFVVEEVPLYDPCGSGDHVYAQIEKAEETASPQAPVVIGSVQTLMREKRLRRWPPDHFGLVVVDEAYVQFAGSSAVPLLARHERRPLLARCLRR